MDNLIIGFILFLFGTLLRADFKESIIDSDDLVKKLLTLHEEYCGNTTDLCMADSERNPGPLMFPMPCCAHVTCSCLSRCEAEHTCCPMYLMRLQGDRGMKVQNQSNQTGQGALNGRGIIFQSGDDSYKEPEEPSSLDSKSAHTEEETNNASFSSTTNFRNLNSQEGIALHQMR